MIPKVFISYSHDSSDHRNEILALADRLRSDGIDCDIDQYLNGAPPKGWIRWMEQKIEWADFVLVVCTENYLKRFNGDDRLAGKGVNFEGLLISQTLYDQFLENTKFLPLIKESGNIGHVPLILKGGTTYKIDSDYEQYCRVITNQPAVIKPPIGQARVLPSVQPVDDSVRNQRFDAQATAMAHGNIRRPKPGEPLPPGDPAYIRREADDRLDDEASYYGETFTIKAAADMGKTSLLHRFKGDSEADGKTMALIDFHNYADERFNDRAFFLNQLAVDILRALGRPANHSQPLRLCKEFTDFIQNEVLAANSGNIVLAFDNVDQLLNQSFRDDFFFQLRTWTDLRSREAEKGWRRLWLLLTVATEPGVLVKDINRSPFNITEPIRLKAFNFDELVLLNHYFGEPLDNPALNRLFELLGGHPSLTQRAFYRLTAPRPVELEHLLAKSASNSGEFADHLRGKHEQLANDHELLNGYRQLVKAQVQPDALLFYRLEKQGLARYDDNDQIVPANRLYAQYFEKVL